MQTQISKHLNLFADDSRLRLRSCRRISSPDLSEEQVRAYPLWSDRSDHISPREQHRVHISGMG
jgi:hypothetical protein